MVSTLEQEAAFEGTFKGFLKRQKTAQKPLPALSLTGQTAIVTGSNVGLGLSACQQMLKLGLSHLIMAVRTQAKGDAAASELRKAHPDADISVWILDMESYDSIRSFAEKCNSSLSRIDIAILNAGLMTSSFATNKQTGHENTLQVNYLSTALLTLLLVPVLQAKKASSPKPPVLTIVGSDLAYNGSNLKPTGPILSQFDDPKTFSSMATYASSKLLLMILVAKLSELVDPADVLVNLANPGMTKGTSLGHDGPLIARKIFGVAQHFLARTPEVGASVYLDAALTRGAESHGAFVSDWAIKPFPLLWYKEEGKSLGTRLVDETMKDLGPAGAVWPVKA
ncbi:hypothetical protein G7054_g1798 [Neopestalotiopsis clavispora]|nr:hypothetical protein G7054_g1798 [Neopestalotiopsis clavispora]